MQRFLTILKIIMLVFLGSRLTGCNNTYTIMDALEERDANETIILLQNKGITASKLENPMEGDSKIKTWRIIVHKESDISPSIKILSDKGIPKNKGIDMVDIFKPSGLIPSPQEEQIRYQTAIQHDLASTISRFTGILDTKVYISVFQNLTQQENFGATTIKPIRLKASIYIKHNGVLDDPNLQLRSKIRRLVSNSVVGLAYDDVSVIGERSENIEQNIIFGTAVPSNTHTKMVSVMGINITVDSLFLLQIIIGVLAIIILLLLIIAGWFTWKNSSIIINNWKDFFSLKPFSSPKESPPPPEDKTKPATPSPETKPT